jgi:hypothetical protein
MDDKYRGLPSADSILIIRNHMPYTLTDEQEDIIEMAVQLSNPNTGGTPATSNILKISAVAGA